MAGVNENTGVKHLSIELGGSEKPLASPWMGPRIFMVSSGVWKLISLIYQDMKAEFLRYEGNLLSRFPPKS